MPFGTANAQQRPSQPAVREPSRKGPVRRTKLTSASASAIRSQPVTEDLFAGCHSPSSRRGRSPPIGNSARFSFRFGMTMNGLVDFMIYPSSL